MHISSNIYVEVVDGKSVAGEITELDAAKTSNLQHLQYVERI